MRRVIAALLCGALLCMPVRGAEEEKLVALTFDDGPSGRFTRRLLEGLHQREARATFLLCGYRMEIYPELTVRILEEGHEVGLHGYSHCPMDTMNRRELDEEIRRTRALIPDGYEIRFLRPPGGMGSDATCAGAKAAGLGVLYWSLDPRDWETRNRDETVKRVLSRVKDGDVILLHDMSDSSVDAALIIVDTLQKQGFRFVTASELAAEKGISITPGEEYSDFK